MTIQFASDLHLEFSENREFMRKNPLNPIGDILVLAGDIVPFEKMEFADDFFDFCSSHFKETYWIAGNHEYYYGNLKDRTGQFKVDIRSNVFLINNFWIQKDNTRIIFSTLWTSISTENAWHIQNGLNDYHLIKDGDKLFTTRRSNELFEENIAFIKETVLANKLEKCIVVTHHVPTFLNYPEEYKGSILNQAFAVELFDFIENSTIDYWIYGHHHRNREEFKIGNTTLVTNQLGYVKNNEHLQFENEKCLKIN